MGRGDFEPSASSYEIVIAGLCRAAKVHVARRMAREAQSKGLHLSTQCYNEILGADSRRVQQLSGAAKRAGAGVDSSAVHSEILQRVQRIVVLYDRMAQPFAPSSASRRPQRRSFAPPDRAS
eukprot:5526365-Prorocentrum_lima.AAC.1